MGNVLHSSHRPVKLMKLNGEVVKRRTPVSADEIMRVYPGHVVLHSEAVRHLGVKAKPLDGCINLKPGHLYFVVEFSKLQGNKPVARRVSSGRTMNAESRLENLLLGRRSVSDLSIINSSGNNSGKGEDSGAVRVKVRLTKSQLAKMMAESEGSLETRQKILESCLEQTQSLNMEDEQKDRILPWKSPPRSIAESCKNAKANRVRFVAPQHGEVC